MNYFSAIAEGDETQDILLSLAKSVANTSAALVSFCFKTIFHNFLNEVV